MGFGGYAYGVKQKQKIGFTPIFFSKTSFCGYNFGLWTLDFALCTLHFALCTLDFGLWTCAYNSRSSTGIVCPILLYSVTKLLIRRATSSANGTCLKINRSVSPAVWICTSP